MGIPEWIAVASVTVAFVGFAVQLFLTRRQARVDGEVEICLGNRENLKIGIEKPHLLTLIGGINEQEEMERAYCQLWVNQVEIMFRRHKPIFPSTSKRWAAAKRDMLGLMQAPAIRVFWSGNHQYYFEDFQRFVNEELYGREAEASQDEAPAEPSPDQASKT